MKKTKQTHATSTSARSKKQNTQNCVRESGHKLSRSNQGTGICIYCGGKF